MLEFGAAHAASRICFLMPFLAVRWRCRRAAAYPCGVEGVTVRPCFGNRTPEETLLFRRVSVRQIVTLPTLAPSSRMGRVLAEHGCPAWRHHCEGAYPARPGGGTP